MNDLSSLNHNTTVHCVCPHGYTGQFCEIQVETCGRNDDNNNNNHHHHNHACYHGGKCMKSHNGYQCVCNHMSPSYNDHYRNYNNNNNNNDDHHQRNKMNDYLPVSIGKSCEHKATSFCHTDTKKVSYHSFCTNGGICKSLIKSSSSSNQFGDDEEREEHEGCHCPNGFSGAHCEVYLPAEVPLSVPDLVLPQYEPQQQPQQPPQQYSGSTVENVTEEMENQEDNIVVSVNHSEYNVSNSITFNMMNSDEVNQMSNKNTFLMLFFVLACTMGFVFFKTQSKSDSKSKSQSQSQFELTSMDEEDLPTIVSAMKGESC